MEKLELEIIDYTHDGLGLGRDQNKVVFLDEGVIGDKVIYETLKEKKSFKRGRVLEIKKPSVFRHPSPCPYFENCGGCSFLNVDEKVINNWKEKRIEKILSSLADDTTKKGKLIKENSLYYRNNIQLKVQNGQLGYYSKKTNKLVKIDKCLLAKKEINEIITLLIKQDLRGLKNIYIRQNYKNDIMLILEGEKISNKIIASICEKVISLYEKKNNEFKLIYGKSYLEEKIGEIKFKLGPGSFFQINHQVMNKIYELAIEKLDLKKEDKLLDLYCGIGTMTLIGAQKCKEALGIEYVEEAVCLARENAEENKIENTSFIAGKVEDLLNKIKDFNKVLVDPPRKGMDRKVIEKLLDLQPEKIVYVSCNVDTQKRDLEILKEKYKISYIQAADMFPMTPHVECIALIQRVKS